MIYEPQTGLLTPIELAWLVVCIYLSGLAFFIVTSLLGLTGEKTIQVELIICFLVVLWAIYDEWRRLR